MRRPSPWLVLAVVLLGIIFLREPRLQRTEDVFLRWLLQHSRPPGGDVPLTVVEIGRDALMDVQSADEAVMQPGPLQTRSAASVSPLEFALFLQSVLDFQPGVIAFESILRWRDRDKDQEQVFLDQAMRVPKLLLASELTSSPDPDDPGPEYRGFPNVTGKRGDLVEFSGVSRHPSEDLRLISTPGFVNLPDEAASDISVPLLFLYRGEVVPSLPLQAIMLWLRITPADVNVVMGSHIALGPDRTIPIRTDGTLLVHPEAAKKARRLTLNELLLAAQQRETNAGGADLPEMRDHVVLARTPANPLAPPDVFAATIATIQSNTYLRRISRLFDCVVLALLIVIALALRRAERLDVILYAIAITAAYCLVALGLLTRWNVWLPGILPLGGLWLAAVSSLFRTRHDRPTATTVTIPPPIA